MASPGPAENRRRPAGNPISELIRAIYALLSDTSFAIFVIIALAVASILAMWIVDQVPFRGEMARMRFPDRQSEPWIWFLTHVVPEHPYRSAAFRTLLALLSLSLLSCIIKRWNYQWRQALGNPLPTNESFKSSRAVGWISDAALTPEKMVSFFKSRLFRVDVETSADSLRLAATRFGVARLGPILTHVGFLLLVIGGLLMASTGTSSVLWMRPGDWVKIGNSDVRMELVDFEIETTERGQVADYVSTVQLIRDTTVVREHRLEVNKPLRYGGYSFYQSSYRSDPTQLRQLQIVFDAPLDEADAAERFAAEDEASLPPGEPATDLQRGGRPGGMPRSMAEGMPGGMPKGMPGTMPSGMSRDVPPQMREMMPHDQMPREFHNPVTLALKPGEAIQLPHTPYTAKIDTFFTDFRIGQDGPMQGSPEARNPAVRLAIFEAGQLLGYRWHFLFHPEMAIGSGPELPIRFATFDGLMQTGLEMSTHPGSNWVWAGFAIMTLGTLVAFLLRHERVLLRARRRRDGWEIDWIHTGAGNQDPALVDHPWQAAITGLNARFMEILKPKDGRPHRWPGKKPPHSGG